MDDRSPVLTLTGFERQQLDAVLDALLPGGSPRLPLSGRDVDAASHVVDHLSRLPWHARHGFRLLVVLLSFSPLWWNFQPRTLAGLRAEEGAKLLESLLSSRFYLIRQLAFLVRELCCMAYGADPRVMEAIAAAAPLPSPPEQAV
jgi:hypothetical protein